MDSRAISKQNSFVWLEKESRRPLTLLVLFSFSGAYVFLLFSGCTSESEKQTLSETPYQLDVPFGLPEIQIPDENPVTAERVSLGKSLFFEKKLSSDQTISCAASEFWSIEFSVQGPVPEWNGQIVRIPREEDAVALADGPARFLAGPQTELWLIRSNP